MNRHPGHTPRPAWLGDPFTWHHTDADSIAVHVSAADHRGRVSVALEVPGGLGAGGVWVDDVPAASLAAHLGFGAGQ